MVHGIYNTFHENFSAFKKKKKRKKKGKGRIEPKEDHISTSGVSMSYWIKALNKGETVAKHVISSLYFRNPSLLLCFKIIYTHHHFIF